MSQDGHIAGEPRELARIAADDELDERVAFVDLIARAEEGTMLGAGDLVEQPETTADDGTGPYTAQVIHCYGAAAASLRDNGAPAFGENG